MAEETPYVYYTLLSTTSPLTFNSRSKHVQTLVSIWVSKSGYFLVFFTQRRFGSIKPNSSKFPRIEMGLLTLRPSIASPTQSGAKPPALPQVLRTTLQPMVPSHSHTLGSIPPKSVSQVQVLRTQDSSNLVLRSVQIPIILSQP